MIKLIATEDKKTAEQLSSENIEKLSHAHFAKLLKHKSIHVNGKIIKKDISLSKGDILELFIEDLFYDLILDPDVIYEDENMIIFNKPSGMSCEYPEDPEERTVLSIAETMMRQSDEYNPDILTVPYLCTPHARQIGGLTVVAKDENTYLAFSEAIRQRRIRRFYTALTVGIPPRHKGELHSYIVTNAKKEAVKVQDVPGNMAQPAVTRYSVIAADKEAARVEIEPVTNIPLQIQAQFKYIGHPILGCQKFADRSANNRFGIFGDSLWLKRLEFCVGENNELSYLNGASFSITKAALPYISAALEEE